MIYPWNLITRRGKPQNAPTADNTLGGGVQVGYVSVTPEQPKFRI